MKLSKDQEMRLSGIVDDLRERSNKLDQAVMEFNNARNELLAKVNTAIEEYNESLGEARELRDEVTGDAEMAIAEKSEKWQESEKGQAAESWKDTWGDLELDDAEISEPDEIDMPSTSHADDLEQTPSESEL